MLPSRFLAISTLLEEVSRRASPMGFPLLICVKDRSAGLRKADQDWSFDLCPERRMGIGQGSWPEFGRIGTAGPLSVDLAGRGGVEAA